MMRVSRAAFLTLLLLLPALAAPACGPRTAVTTPSPSPAAAAPPPAERPVLRDTHETLQGVLWMQTAAEFWALAATAYRDAQSRLDAALQDTSFSAAVEQKAGYESLPPAVILDVDETVLDNAPFQAQMVRERTPYLRDMWTAWVATRSAPAIPGAREFIAHARARSVAVFLVTNRTLEEQADTLANLAALDIPATDETLLCSGENNWTSDKSARRAAIAKTHRVVMLVGDDLNDFVSTTGLTPAERRQLAMAYRERWARQWILIPNPMYGTWDRALHPGLTEDAAILQKKRETVDGFR